nr:MAG TPA: hypothetical protein [Caudoviricetes sp.]
MRLTSYSPIPRTRDDWELQLTSILPDGISYARIL